jgi:hypothetical protein
VNGCDDRRRSSRIGDSDRLRSNLRVEEYMNPVNNGLPEGFADLQPFVAVWGGLSTPEARYLQRQESRIEDLRAFYDAVVPRFKEALAYLDTFPMDEPLPAPEALLYRVILGLTEVAAAVEVYNQPRVPYVAYPHYNSVVWTDHGRHRPAP